MQELLPDHILTDLNSTSIFFFIPCTIKDFFLFSLLYSYLSILVDLSLCYGRTVRSIFSYPTKNLLNQLFIYVASWLFTDSGTSGTTLVVEYLLIFLSQMYFYLIWLSTPHLTRKNLIISPERIFNSLS